MAYHNLTEEQHERAADIKDELEAALKKLVNKRLVSEHPNVEDLVRTLLTEQMRFWKE